MKSTLENRLALSALHSASVVGSFGFSRTRRSSSSPESSMTRHNRTKDHEGSRDQSQDQSVNRYVSISRTARRAYSKITPAGGSFTRERPLVRSAPVRSAPWLPAWLPTRRSLRRLPDRNPPARPSRANGRPFKVRPLEARPTGFGGVHLRTVPPVRVRFPTP